ncbi:stage II sporulation protein M [Staphylococcus gallinarum]|uniref:stage II sporulation protein M n=1 Tax=Staphylococcus gallinarum TaxID=1293 RepID=UPI001E5CDEA3|nr:stage II sporulation protein M [Staphylococcus gallinarum]MCD8917392.1 stage II sporulation protein M [Staphylococcus gallinarum]
MLKIQDDTYVKRTLRFLTTTLSIFIITFILAIIFSPSAETIKNIFNSVPNNVDGAEGLKKVWEYILNNGFKVPFQMLILAIIPIPFLYYLNIISTTILPAIAVGFAINFDKHKGIILSISAIPHFIIEILAFCFVASSLLKVNQSIIRKIANLFRKSKKQKFSIKLAITNLIKIYIFIALPLFIVAAFVENYLSKIIFDLLT